MLKETAGVGEEEKLSFFLPPICDMKNMYSEMSVFVEKIMTQTNKTNLGRCLTNGFVKSFHRFRSWGWGLQALSAVNLSHSRLHSDNLFSMRLSHSGNIIHSKPA